MNLTTTAGARIPPTVQVSGLFGYYGLDLLSPGYKGALLRIRRSSDSAETDIHAASGSTVWDSAAAVAFAGAGDAFVSRVYAQDAEHNDFVQTDTTLQPKVVSSGVALANIEFTSGYMQSVNPSKGLTNKLTLAYRGFWRTSPLPAPPAWLAFELSVDANVNNAAYLGGETSSGNDFIYAICEGSGNRIAGITVGGTNPNTLGAVIAVFDKSLVGNNRRKLYYDGTQMTDSSTSDSGVVTSGNFGSYTWYIGGRQASSAQRGPISIRRWAMFESVPDLVALNAAMS